MKYEKPEMEIKGFKDKVTTDVVIGSQEPSIGTGGETEW